MATTIPKFCEIYDDKYALVVCRLPKTKDFYTFLRRGYLDFIKSTIHLNPARKLDRITLDQLYKMRMGHYYRADTGYDPVVREGLYEHYLMEVSEKSNHSTRSDLTDN